MHARVTTAAAAAAAVSVQLLPVTLLRDMPYTALRPTLINLLAPSVWHIFYLNDGLRKQTVCFDSIFTRAYMSTPDLCVAVRIREQLVVSLPIRLRRSEHRHSLDSA